MPTSVRQHIHFYFYYFLYIYGKMHVFRNFVKFNQTWRCRCGFVVVVVVVVVVVEALRRWRRCLERFELSMELIWMMRGWYCSSTVVVIGHCSCMIHDRTRCLFHLTFNQQIAFSFLNTHARTHARFYDSVKESRKIFICSFNSFACPTTSST